MCKKITFLKETIIILLSLSFLLLFPFSFFFFFLLFFGHLFMERDVLAREVPPGRKQ